MKKLLSFVGPCLAVVAGVWVALLIRSAAREQQANRFEDGYGQFWSVLTKGQDGANMCRDNGGWQAQTCQYMTWKEVDVMFHGKVRR